MYFPIQQFWQIIAPEYKNSKNTGGRVQLKIGAASDFVGKLRKTLQNLSLDI